MQAHGYDQAHQPVDPLPGWSYWGVPQSHRGGKQLQLLRLTMVAEHHQGGARVQPADMSLDREALGVLAAAVAQGPRQLVALERGAGEAYVLSQSQEGWLLVADRYDDGGISGATLERPGLKRLQADIEAGKIDVIVVYKVDRLSRSLTDFAKLVDVGELFTPDCAADLGEAGMRGRTRSRCMRRVEAAEIVAVARSWLGTSWHRGSEGPGRCRGREGSRAPLCQRR